VTLTSSPSLDSTLDSSVLEEQLGLAGHVLDEGSLQNSVQRFAEQKIVLPTFGELAEPSRIAKDITKGVDKNAADPRNLFRVHWYNNMAGDTVADVASDALFPVLGDDLRLVVFVTAEAGVAAEVVAEMAGGAFDVVVALQGPFHEGVVKAVAHATAANHRMKLLGTQARLARDAQRV
jgi:hypothetical protein